MSRYFKRASIQYMKNPTAVLSAVPLTLAAWVYPFDNTNSQYALSITTNVGGDTGTGFHLNLGGATAGDPVRAFPNLAGTAGVAVTSTTYQLNKWQHAAAVFYANNLRAAFLDGGGKGTNSTSVTPTGMTETYIGATNANAIVANAMDGYIRLPAIWNDALSDSDIMLLSMGAHPRTVRPDALVAYWELKDEGLVSPGMSRDGAGIYPMTEIAGPFPISEDAWQLNRGIIRPAWMGANVIAVSRVIAADYRRPALAGRR